MGRRASQLRLVTAIHVLGYAFHRLVIDWRLPTAWQSSWRRSVYRQRQPPKHTSPVLQVCPNRSKFQLSWSRAMHDKWCQSIVTLSVRQVATRGTALATSTNEAIPRTSVQNSREQSRPNRWPFSFRWRMCPRQVEAVPSLFYFSDRAGAGRSTLFTWPGQGEHLTGRDPMPMNGG